jgi:hypothetical protein
MQIRIILNTNYSLCGHFLTVLRIRIRDPMPFGPMDPGSEIGFFRISDPKLISFESLMTICCMKRSIILCKLSQFVFFTSLKKKFKLCEIYGYKNIKNKKIFSSPLSLDAVFRSGINIPDPQHCCLENITEWRKGEG